MDNIKKNIDYLSELTGVQVFAFDVKTRGLVYPYKHYCGGCRGCSCENTHLYGCFEAHRWDGKYIYYCPRGFIFMAAAVLDDREALAYGIIAGPVVMGDAEDYGEYEGAANLSTVRVGAMSELMAALFSTYGSNKNGEGKNSKATLLNEIYKAAQEERAYPIEVERQLQKAIACGDKQEALKLLNVLLGHIFFYSNGEFETIKLRALELIVLLSRSAIDGGAVASDMFKLNSGYINQVNAFDSLEQLSVWLSGVINRYVSYVFELKDAKHTDTLFKVVGYIKENYNKKITLDEIAAHVYLSKSYLSNIFKREMNQSLTSYINSIRIEKSKELLADGSKSLVEIAHKIGFDDQSYFTKIFKKEIGISPGRFREKKVL